MSRVNTNGVMYVHGAQNITPSNTVSLETPAVGLFVGGAGNISAVMENGDTVTFTGVTAGAWLPFVFARINATGTTATNLVGGK